MAGDPRVIDVSEVHESHLPEGLDEYLMTGLCWCKRCCRLVATSRLGVRAAGRKQCTGPLEIVLRDGGMAFERPSVPSTKEPTE